MQLTFASTEIGAEEFHRRRALARRNGTPAWLWPEVTVATWAQAMAQIGATAAAVLSGETATLHSNDLMAASLACYTSGLGPLLGWWCEKGLLSADAETASLLSAHLEQSRARGRRIDAKSREIVSALAESGVAVIVLKGGHTAHRYFPDPATRPASDLDLLVPADQTRLTERVLSDRRLLCVERRARESSWIPADEKREPVSLWLVHADDPWSIDLHGSLDFAASPGASVVKLDAAEPFTRSDAWPVNPAAGVLRQPLLLLHLAVHASGGLHSLTMLRMVEIILVIREDLASGQLSWDEFLELAERTKGLAAAYPALRMSEKLAPGTIPPKVLRRCAEAAPSRVRAIIDTLEPATAQRVDRASVSEHFMWVRGLPGWVRQLRSDLAPPASIWPIYQARAYRLLRGRISR